MTRSATMTRSRAREARRDAARRRASRRRRRARAALAVVVGLAALAVAAIVLAPTFQHAVRDFTLPLRHERIIRVQAREKGLDPALVAAVIYAESKFSSDSSSPTGAKGLMQIQPSTAHFIARRTGGTKFVPEDLGTPRVNIAYGSYYLRYLLDRYDGDEVLALAAYNGGEGNVNRWLAKARAEHRSLRRDDIPFTETRAYVDRVLDARKRYASTYPKELGL